MLRKKMQRIKIFNISELSRCSHIMNIKHNPSYTLMYSQMYKAHVKNAHPHAASTSNTHALGLTNRWKYVLSNCSSALSKALHTGPLLLSRVGRPDKSLTPSSDQVQYIREMPEAQPAPGSNGLTEWNDNTGSKSVKPLYFSGEVYKHFIAEWQNALETIALLSRSL